MRHLAVVGLMLLSSVGCGLPHDAEGTLQRVRGGVMKVGVVANQPWVVDTGAEPRGIEPMLVAEIAGSVGARVSWVKMPEFEIVRALKERQLELAIGGFDRKVTWAQEVALTRPYLETADGRAHVLAAPPGENGWLYYVERQLEAHKASVPPLLASVRQ